MPSSLSKRRFTLRHPVVVDVGCSCRRSKLASFFFPNSNTHRSRPPKPNPHTPPKHHHPLSSYYPFSPSTTTFSTTTISAWDVDTTSSTASPFSLSPPRRFADKKKKPAVAASTTTTSSSSSSVNKGRVAKESVAVVKESQDPYHDFRDSMLQMILEKEIYAMDDLRDLLQRFLSLNSPYHHDSILRAFSEIWSTVFSSSSKPTRGTNGGGGQQRRRRHHHRRLPRDPHV